MKSTLKIYFLVVAILFALTSTKATVIEKRQTLPQTCGPNEEYLPCGPSCQTECPTLNQPCLIRHFRCPDGCYCKKNFARITIGGRCVPVNKCPRT